VPERLWAGAACHDPRALTARPAPRSPGWTPGGQPEGGFEPAGRCESASRAAGQAALSLDAWSSRPSRGGQVDDDEFTIGLGSAGQREDRALKTEGD
jgi:hypothetical protein